MKSTSLIFATLMALAPVTAQSATWRVEQDGSGDFTDIQPAVDAAAAGDTILIGPGRFDTFHPFTAPGWMEEVIVGVTKDDLTFIGSGKDITVIGTSLPYGGISDDPKSICSIGSFDCEIRDLTIENVNTGIYWWEGNLDVAGCIIRGQTSSYLGFIGWFESLEVRDCGFELNGSAWGIATLYPSKNVSLLNCDFSGSGTGMVSGQTKNIVISNCNFDHINVGVHLDNGSTGIVSNCNFLQINTIGLALSYNSVVEIHDVHFSGSKEGMRIGSGSVLTGSRVVIENSSDTSILLSSQVYLHLRECHIFPSTIGRAVWVIGFPYEYINQDLRENYWGTTDPDSISAMIWDWNDDPSLHTTVLFEPFAGGYVPTEKKSFGSVKAMFR